jgi:hypothetical protein
MERERGKRLFGRVEIDDAYLDGEKVCCRGRGSRNKVPFVAAVETTQDGIPVKIQLRLVREFRKWEIARYTKSCLAPGSNVISDGLWCFKGVTEAACSHNPIVTGGGRQSVQLLCFKWSNAMLGKVKNSLLGTFHANRVKHMPRYLAEFEYLFNRRLDLPSMIDRLIYVALRTPSMPYRLLIMAEIYG